MVDKLTGRHALEILRNGGIVSNPDIHPSFLLVGTHKGIAVRGADVELALVLTMLLYSNTWVDEGYLVSKRRKDESD